MSSVESTKRGRSGARLLAGRKPDALPAFVPPCLATLADAPPEGADWVHEIKLDGYRLEARIANGSVQLLTRTGLDWTGRFPSIAKALKGLRVKSALIDGEAVVEDAHGVTSFAALVEALEQRQVQGMRFVAFDLLHLNGVALTPAPLLGRKELLESVLKPSRSRHLRYSAHLAGDGEAVLREACTLGLEGVISKRADRPYRSGRNGDWLKSKCVQTDEFVIGGYLTSSVDSKAVGALALGTFEKGKLVYRGRVGTGFTHKSARAVWQALQPLRSTASPFSAALTAVQRRGVTWVEPALVAQIAYRSRTGDGLLRHAAFKGLRQDKPARDVHWP
ncbi:non-homologous end-joining DNA ligase [Hyphomicrobium sp.]|uniref:non-homologous end-joining DNA ligase n=1 Tax=Hyphomicrobium sp. TaxID=82 RepID=UPI002FDF2256